MVDDIKNIQDSFQVLNMTISNIEKIHPNGEYKVESNTINDIVLWTSGFLPCLERQLNKHGLYIHTWVVYPEYISFIIATWSLD